jgi:hypothetical protein
VTRPGVRTAWWAAVLVCVLSTPAWAQLTLPPGTPGLPAGPETATARRGPITITPSLSILGEYNDNVFQSNANRESDFIVGFVPGISVVLEGPTYRLLGSYSFTAEIYAENEQLNDAFSRQNLRLDGTYRATPQLTLSLSDSFIISQDSNAIAVENVSTGRTESLSNTLSGGAAYQIDPRWTVRGRATWTTLRYDDDLSIDSDTYALEGFVDRAFTARLTGTAGYQFAYFDIEDQPGVSTHTPRVGVTYRFTQNLTGAVSGGPSIQVVEDGDTDVFPAITASLQQRFSWGAATVQYDHAIGTAGGLGGTTENQSIGAVIQVDRLLRGLVLQFAPRYTREQSTGSTGTGDIDVDTISLTLQARYEITRYMAAIAGYTFYRQRSDNATVVVTPAGTVTANDVDQNRVFVGLQFGYPITID